MLIGQVTDIHLGFEPDNPGELNRQRLDAVLAHMAGISTRPDILLATGDLVDRGDRESYERLRQAFSTCPIPALPCMGNHDERAPFRAVFPEFAGEGGFIQYHADIGALRLIIVDTLEEGRHGGAFCDTRARWLSDRLVEEQDRPTLIVMHHPPVELGIEWMNTDPREPWVARFADAISGHAQVRGIICGHVHRPIVSAFEGVPLAVCPSTAPQVALDLAPIDPERPDGRPMIVAEPPAYALHWWNGQALVSHFEKAESYPVLASFDERMQPLVRGMVGERPA